jgi:HSP20 family protein
MFNLSTRRPDAFERVLGFPSLFDLALDFKPEVEPMRINVKETDDNYLVEAEVPAADKDEVDVTVENGYVTISVEHKESNETKNERNIVKEMRAYSCQRSVRLPENIKSDNVEAELEKGILHLTIPKAESAKPKKVKIDVK